VAAGPIVDDGTGGLYQTSADLTAYYSPTRSTIFLQNRKSSGPYRYFGFDPALQSESDIPPVPYRRNFADDITAQLIVNNRASIFRLGDIQGQDFPALLRRYAEFLEAMNGEAMDNRDADVTAAGVMSPLLDLLNVRYIVIPADVSTDQPEFAQLLQTYSSVYMDSSDTERGVQVLERASGLPRAWFVHDVRSVNEGDAIQLLKFGGLYFGETALVEGPVPPLGQPPEGAREPVSLTVNEPGHVSVVVKAAAPGLVVLSQTYYPGWKAYVDGKEVDTYPTDHVLIGVPFPAGEHTLELRFQSRPLKIGIGISSLTLLVAFLIVVVSAWQLLNPERTKLPLSATTAASGDNAKDSSEPDQSNHIQRD
jgi:hypothetical protein